MKHLKLLLKSLINNNSCVEAARSKEKKYIIFAFAFAIVSLFLAVLPSAVTGFNQQGSSWISSYTSNLDKAWLDLANRASNDNIALTIKDDKTISLTNWEENLKDTNALVFNKDGVQQTDSKYNLVNLPRFIYRANLIPEDDTTLKDFVEIYAFNQNGQELQTIVQQLLNNENPYSTTDDDKYLAMKENENGEYYKVGRSTTLMVFGLDCFYAYAFKPDNTTAIASLYGDYHHMNPGDIITRIADEDKSSWNTICNLKDFSNLGFIDTRNSNTWKQVFTILGVDSGVLLLMTLMIWILTRGKNNPFRIYTMWDGFKISCFASLTPGILGLLGFLIPNMAMMIYIVLLGIRIMWLSMHSLNYKYIAAQMANSKQ